MFLMIDKYDFSEWLRKEMKNRVLTQSELARLSGLHRAVISKTINQVSAPTPDTIEAIAHGLKLPAEVVYRAAGLLPPIPEKRTQIEELNYLVSMLSGAGIQDIIE